MKSLLFSAFLIAAAALTTPGQAQAPEPAAHARVLDAITVTAQKREQNLQDVPISISVVTGEKISDFLISDLLDLAQYIPNLTIEEGTEGAALTLRGIGNNGGTNFGFDSSIGIFVDGIYHGRANQSRLPYLDVERVEVLRGPQNVLFGMNTVAGAISVTSRQPTNKFEADIQLSHDPQYENTAITGVISGPITETLSGRLALLKTEEEGYFHNTFHDSDGNGSDDDGARMTLRWEPAERWTVTTKLERSTRFQNGIARQIFSPPSDPDILARQLAADPDATFAPDLEVSNNREFRDLTSNTAVLTVDYAFDKLLLTSISSYSSFDGFSVLDVDSSSLDVGVIRAEEDFEQISQELRVTSEPGKPIEFITGVFYQDSDLAHDRLLDFALGEFIPAFAGTPAGQKQTYAGNLAQAFQTLSAFGQVTWNLTDDLRLIAGARYSSEEKHASSYFDWMVPGTTDPRNALDPASPEFAIAHFVFHDVFRIERHSDRGTYHHDSFLPELKLQWDVTDDSVLYVSRSEGQKSGGFNDRDNRGTNFSFDAESSTNYELGTKSTLLGGAAQLVVVLFRTEFEDMQVSVFDLPNLIFIVDNAAKALSQGVELEGIWRPAEGFTLNGSLGWLEKAKFVEFLVPCVAGPAEVDCVPSSDGDIRDEGGRDLNTPDLTASLGLGCRADLAPGLEMTARVDVNYRSDSVDAVNRSNGIDSVSFVNARVALASKKGWSLAVVGNNLTDERFIVTRGAGLFAGTEQGDVRPPRTITLQTGFRF